MWELLEDAYQKVYDSQGVDAATQEVSFSPYAQILYQILYLIYP